MSAVVMQNGRKRGLTESGGSGAQPGKKQKPDVHAAGNSVREQRKQLPICRFRRELVQHLDNHASTVIIGETGSGKTTQIPQYLLENGMHRGHVIAVTQPRRVAAVTVSQRVAMEMDVTLGDKVGYCVRFDDVTSQSTRIKYMTDGMLLREAMLDPQLKRYSWVILDEAHERTVQTDILFGVVRTAQQTRAEKNKLPLKVIVMSATIEAEADRFAAFFSGACVVRVPGRQHDITAYHVTRKHSDHVRCCLLTVWQLHGQVLVGGDFVVFLTGQEEIDHAVKFLRDLSAARQTGTAPLQPVPLYAALPPAQQKYVFDPAPPGTRKVIVSTNVAETSVTLPNVRYVIDSGMVKTRTYNAASGLDVLAVTRISQAQALQRAGRAGREAAGHCYRA